MVVHIYINHIPSMGVRQKGIIKKMSKKIIIPPLCNSFSMDFPFQKTQQPLSLAPVKVTIPSYPEEGEEKSRFPIDYIQKLTDLNNIFYLLFSDSEKKYLQTKYPKVDLTEKKASNLVSKFANSHLPVLEELNAMVLSAQNPSSVPQILEKAKVTQSLPQWFQQTTNQQPNEKALVLNLICICSLALAKNQQLIFDIIKSTVDVLPSLAKKYYFATTLLLSQSFKDKDTEKLVFTMCPSIVVSFQPSFDFLLYGGLPPALKSESELIEKYGLFNELQRYISTGKMKVESNNQDARQFLINFAQLIPDYIQSSLKLYRQISRFVTSPVSIQAIFDDSTPAENEKDCDATSLFIIASFFMIHEYLYSSNFFDADIFAYFLDKANITQYFLQSITKDPNSIVMTQYDYPIMEALIIIYGYLVGHLLQNSPFRVSANITEKALRQITSSAESSQNEAICSSVAFVVSRCLNWVPKTIKNTEKLDTTLISFVFMHLEKFELYEKYYGDDSAVPETLASKTYIPNLQQHAKDIGLSIFQSIN